MDAIIDVAFSSAALENYCRNEPISEIIWMKLDLPNVSYPESVVTQVSVNKLPVRGGDDNSSSVTVV